MAKGVTGEIIVDFAAGSVGGLLAIFSAFKSLFGEIFSGDTVALLLACGIASRFFQLYVPPVADGVVVGVRREVLFNKSTIGVSSFARSNAGFVNGSFDTGFGVTGFITGGLLTFSSGVGVFGAVGFGVIVGFWVMDGFGTIGGFGAIDGLGTIEGFGAIEGFGVMVIGVFGVGVFGAACLAAAFSRRFWSASWILSFFNFSNTSFCRCASVFLFSVARTPLSASISPLLWLLASEAAKPPVMGGGAGFEIAGSGFDTAGLFIAGVLLFNKSAG